MTNEEREAEAKEELEVLGYVAHSGTFSLLDRLGVEFAIGIRAPWCTDGLLESVVKWLPEALQRGMAEALRQRREREEDFRG